MQTYTCRRCLICYIFINVSIYKNTHERNVKCKHLLKKNANKWIKQSKLVDLGKQRQNFAILRRKTHEIIMKMNYQNISQLNTGKLKQKKH
jgi:hypothetical protein